MKDSKLQVDLKMQIKSENMQRKKKLSKTMEFYLKLIEEKERNEEMREKKIEDLLNNALVADDEEDDNDEDNEEVDDDTEKGIPIYRGRLVNSRGMSQKKKNQKFKF